VGADDEQGRGESEEPGDGENAPAHGDAIGKIGQPLSHQEPSDRPGDKTAPEDERRTKEIGIRKVLGADTSRLHRLMSADSCRLPLIAALVGWPLALYLVRLWLRNFACHVPIQPWTFLPAGLGMLGLMLLTAGTQIYKIARVDPVKTLKYE